MHPRSLSRAPRATHRLAHATIAALLLALGCRGDVDPGAAASIAGPASAKGGNGGGGGGGGGSTTSDPVVSSTNPARAPQDTTLTVAIYGSGFVTGTRALWSLNGDTTHVKVNSTKVVKSTELSASVTVPLSAPVATYDIVVVTPGGKKGVGAEMFIVDEKDPNPDYVFAEGYNIQPDGYSSTYSFAVCGVETRIFAVGSGDAVLDTEKTSLKDRKCSGYPRKLLINYGDGVSGTASRMNLTVQGNYLHNIPIGATEMRGLNIGDSRCLLRFKSVLQDGQQVEGDYVLVTRTGAGTWEVQTQPPPNNRAYCINLDRSFNISVKFTIDAKRAMPVP